MMDKNYKYYKAIDWNSIEDEIDKSTWEKLTEQFWLDTRVPLSNDLDDWRKLSPAEKDLIGKVFGGLTLLDTMQSESGVEAIRNDCRTQHEEAVLNNIQFMEAVHAKSYSSIFSTLNTKKEIEDIFEWTNNNEYLQKKAKIINEIYERGSALEKKVASVFLESYLFYSGFFYPLYLAGLGKMTTSGEIIRKIMLDETIHGSCVGYSAQEIYNELTEHEQKRADKEVYELLWDLFENEVAYTKEIYSQIGMEDEVIEYVKYNGNRALANLGRPHEFNHDPINPIIENALNTSSKNHDFFSVKGDSYVVSTNVEEITDEDWDF